MTVAAIARIIKYVEDGTTVTFAVPFAFLSADDLHVTRLSDDGSETVLAPVLDFSVSGGDGAAGAITITSGPYNGQQLVIAGSTVIEQQTAYTEGDRFPAKSHEGALDRLTMIAQEQRDAIEDVGGRAVLLPKTGAQLGAVVGQFPVVLPDGRWGFASGTGADSGMRTDLASTESGKGALLVGTDDGRTVAAWLLEADQPAGTAFYAPTAKIQRLNERVFIGAATAHNGTDTGPQPDWLTTYLISKGRAFGFQHIATFAVLGENNTAGQNAIVGGAQTVDLTAIGNSIGVLGIGVNNNAAYGTGAWGGYFEGFQDPGQTGPAYAGEFDAINFGSTGSITPYAQANNQVISLQVASGAEFVGANAAHAAMNVQNNGARFDVGINFGATSLVGTDGTGTGTATAMRLARGHGLQWMASNTIVTSQIFSTAATAAGSHTLTFNEGSTTWTNSSSGNTQFAIINSGSSVVNYLAAQGSATGNPSQLKALGSDTNIGLQFVPKGNARLSVPLANIPNYANDAAAQAGGVLVDEIYRNGSVVMIRAA